MRVRMKGGTLFSGIGAPELAAPWIDWRWSAEIDPFASSVHAARFPNVPNLGDVREFPDAVEPVELVVFGSPCQSFSVAGKRAGLDDPRGNMALVGLQIIDRIRPDWVVFENVPGLLSSDDWRDFGTFLGALGECGYGFAYRVLDAQYAGVPQRRRRVFVIGYFGDWRPPAAVLFEPESLRGDSPPRRETREGIAAPLSRGAERDGDKGYAGRRREDDSNLIAKAIKSSGGGIDREDGHTLIAFHGSQDPDISGTVSHPLGNQHNGFTACVAYGGNRQSGPLDVATACNAHGGPHGRMDFETETFLTHSLRADGFDASEDGTGRGPPLIPVMAAGAHGANGAGVGIDGDPMFTLDRTGAQAIAFAENSRAELRLQGGDGQIAGSLKVGGGKAGQSYPAVAFTERTRADGRNFEAQKDLAYALCNPGEGGRAQERNLLDASMSVRRLTPTECERLQGFPDSWTAIRFNGKPAADGPRYRALGNAMAVPAIGWILSRIREFETHRDSTPVAGRPAAASRF